MKHFLIIATALTVRALYIAFIAINIIDDYELHFLAKLGMFDIFAIGVILKFMTSTVKVSNELHEDNDEYEAIMKDFVIISSVWAMTYIIHIIRINF